MKIICLAFLCSMLALSIEAALHAQTPGRLQQPSQAAGQDASAARAAASGQTGAFDGIIQAPWFGNQQVLDHLKLSTDQVNRLRDNYTQFWNRYDSDVKSLRNSAVDESVRQRQQQLAQAFNNNFGRSVDSIISDPVQRQRFDQLAFQFRGLGVFDDPTIQQRFNLTVEQRQALNRLQQDWQRQLLSMSEPLENTRASDRTWNDFNRQLNQSAEEVFTPEQLRAWRELRGEAFVFPESTYLTARPTNISSQ